MAEFKVTPSELRNKALTLRNLNQQFRSQVTAMIGYEQQLAGMWEGEAQRAFRKAFNDDKQKMDRFAENIDKYIQALETDAAKYEEAEQKNLGVASTRKS